LADEYADVVIVERDQLPSGTEHRKGVPHSHHVHAMLPSGVRVIEELLPGVTEQLIADGALPGDILANTRWLRRRQNTTYKLLSV